MLRAGAPACHAEERARVAERNDMRDRVVQRLYMIHSSCVRHFLVAVPLIVGCAHAQQEDVEMPHARRSAVAAPLASVDREVIAVDTAPPQLTPAYGPRPRLSHVVTLGAGSDVAAYSSAEVRASAPAERAHTVVVNNYSPAGGAYGYLIGGGYGGHGYTLGGDRYVTAPRAGEVYGRGAQGQPITPWAPTGWEGPGRTAAPGQTPGIGGNFPAVRSFGPAPMR